MAAPPAPSPVRAPARKVPRAVAKWELLADAGELAGLKNAARGLRHYLAATGTTLHVPVGALLAAEPALRDLVRTAVAGAAAAGPGPFATPWQRYEAASRDWHLALGSLAYRVTGRVSAGGAARYVVSVQDRYHWDASRTTTLPGFGVVRHADLLALARRGLAREYAVRGRSRPLRAG